MADTVVGTIREMVGEEPEEFPKDVIGALMRLDGHIGDIDERLEHAEDELENLPTGVGIIVSNAQIDAMF